MTGNLFMVRMELKQSELMHVGSRKAFSGHHLDLGYLVHCALKESFGEDSPRVFLIEDSRGRDLKILSYGSLDADACRERILSTKCNFIRAASIQSKRMPDELSTGAPYDFQIRLCPVVRKARGAGAHAGRERDVFLDAVEKAGKGALLDRNNVYGGWLSATLTRSAGVCSITTHAVALRQSRVIRRSADRSAKDFWRPDATFTGRFKVENGERLREALRHGIGRHKSFGFGMICLRRAR